RLAELGWLTKLTPEQRQRIENDNAQWALLMSDIRAAQRQSQPRYGLIIGLCDRGLQLRPGNTELLVMRREAVQNQRLGEFQKAREDELKRLGALRMTAANRQAELATQAHEAARAGAEVAAADRERREAQRRAAAKEIVQRAQLMTQAKRF